ncbi:MAG: cell division protein ZapA [Candidatus Babeliales bacterium]
MNNQAKKITVTILGKTYTLMTDESESSVLEAASRVDAAMKDILQKASHMDEHKVAVLVALQQVTRLIEHEAALRSFQKQEDSLISLIDRCMQTTV